MNLNNHKKKVYPPMHTAEHLLNATMIRVFGCSRSFNAHIERKKSKCDYYLDRELSREEIQKVEKVVNRVIKKKLSIFCKLIPRSEVDSSIDLSRLPDKATTIVRIVEIGIMMCVLVLVSML